MSTSSPEIIIPKKKAVAKTGKLPEYYGERNNLAGDEELTKRVWSFLQNQYTFFKDQRQRQNFVDTDGVMDVADRMQRVALRRKKSSDQYSPTKSNQASTIFFRNHRTIVANLNSIYSLVDDNSMPAHYEPMQDDQSGPKRVDGELVAKQYDSLSELTYEQDNRRQKFRKLNWVNTKYGNAIISLTWERLTEERKVRRVTKWSDSTNTIPIKWVEEEKEVVVRDCPKLSLIDLKDAYFDAQIDAESPFENPLDRQRAVLFRQQKGWEELNAEQSTGLLMNVENLGVSQLYQGEDGESDVMQDRMKNAGEQTVTEKNGLFLVWQGWARIPVKELKRKGKPTGKGKWDLNQPLRWYWATYAGEMSSETAVCLRLEKNPFNHGKLPYKLIHLMEDDKGAYHDGISTRTEPLYWQHTTNINQANDNVNLRTETPWFTDGRIETENLEFRRNKVIKIQRGTTLGQLKPDDTTQFNLSNAAVIENDFEKTTGADKPVQGVQAFARTAATVGKIGFDQSMLPIDDMAGYVADQVFPWVWEMDRSLWEQFGDPEMVLSITHNNKLQEVQPIKFAIPLKVKVDCVSRFRNTFTRRTELNNLLSNVWPLARNASTPEGEAILMRNVFEEFKIPDANKIFPLDGDYDAKARATQEVYSMLEVGRFVEPQFGENQRAHLAVEEPILRQYELLPSSDQMEDRKAMLRQHIQMEKDMMQQKQSSIPTQGQPQEQPLLEGQALGDQAAADAGGIA